MSYSMKFEFKVGEMVYDDLTRKLATVIGISYQWGRKSLSDNRSAVHTVGYWLDNDYLGGGRHPWEVAKWPFPKKQRAKR